MDSNSNLIISDDKKLPGGDAQEDNVQLEGIVPPDDNAQLENKAHVGDQIIRKFDGDPKLVNADGETSVAKLVVNANSATNDHTISDNSTDGDGDQNVSSVNLQENDGDLQENYINLIVPYKTPNNDSSPQVQENENDEEIVDELYENRSLNPGTVDVVLRQVFVFMNKRELMKSRLVCQKWNSLASLKLRKKYSSYWASFTTLVDFQYFNQAFKGASSIPVVNYIFPNQFTEPYYCGGGLNAAKTFINLVHNVVKGLKLEISVESNEISEMFRTGYFPNLKTLRFQKNCEKFEPHSDNPQIEEIGDNWDEIVLKFAENSSNLSTFGENDIISLPQLESILFGNCIRAQLAPNFFHMLTKIAPNLKLFTFPATIVSPKYYEKILKCHESFFSAYNSVTNLRLCQLYPCELTDYAMTQLLDWSLNKNFRVNHFGMNVFAFQNQEVSIKKFWKFLQYQSETLVSLELGNFFILDVLGEDENSNEEAVENGGAELAVLPEQRNFNLFREFKRVFFSLQNFSLQTTNSFFVDPSYPLRNSQFPHLILLDITYCSQDEATLKNFIAASDIFPNIKKLYFSQREENSDEFLRVLGQKFPNIECAHYEVSPGGDYEIKSLEVLWTIWRNRLTDLRIIFYLNEGRTKHQNIDDILSGFDSLPARYRVDSTGQFKAIGRRLSIFDQKNLRFLSLGGFCSITDQVVDTCFAGMDKLEEIRHDVKFPNTLQFGDESFEVLEEKGIEIIELNELY